MSQSKNDDLDDLSEWLVCPQCGESKDVATIIPANENVVSYLCLSCSNRKEIDPDPDN